MDYTVTTRIHSVINETHTEYEYIITAKEQGLLLAALRRDFGTERSLHEIISHEFEFTKKSDFRLKDYLDNSEIPCQYNYTVSEI